MRRFHHAGSISRGAAWGRETRTKACCFAPLIAHGVIITCHNGRRGRRLRCRLIIILQPLSCPPKTSAAFEAERLFIPTFMPFGKQKNTACTRHGAPPRSLWPQAKSALLLYIRRKCCANTVFLVEESRLSFTCTLQVYTALIQIQGLQQRQFCSHREASKPNKCKNWDSAVFARVLKASNGACSTGWHQQEAHTNFLCFLERGFSYNDFFLLYKLTLKSQFRGLN